MGTSAAQGGKAHANCKQGYSCEQKRRRWSVADATFATHTAVILARWSLPGCLATAGPASAGPGWLSPGTAVGALLPILAASEEVREGL